MLSVVKGFGVRPRICISLLSIRCFHDVFNCTLGRDHPGERQRDGERHQGRHQHGEGLQARPRLHQAPRYGPMHDMCCAVANVSVERNVSFLRAALVLLTGTCSPWLITAGFSLWYPLSAILSTHTHCVNMVTEYSVRRHAHGGQLVVPHGRRLGHADHERGEGAAAGLQAQGLPAHLDLRRRRPLRGCVLTCWTCCMCTGS
jgi:hypothetical protein